MQEQSKLRFLQEIFGDYKFSAKTKEAEFYCPFCFHHKKKLSINLSNDYWKCWVCNKAGKSLFSLLPKINASQNQIFEYSKNYRAENVVFQKVDSNLQVDLPQEYQAIVNLKDSVMGKRALAYLQSRGVTESQMLRYKIGLCLSGDYQNRILLPSFDKNGNLNFFTTRSIGDNSSLKYLNAKDLEKDHKNCVIINELNIDFTSPVVITEGFFDLFRSIDNTIPLCGSSLPVESYLFQTIIRKKCEIILALDPDAKKKTYKIAKNLLSYDAIVKYVDLSPYRDLGTTPSNEFLERLKSAELVNEVWLLRKKIWLMLE